LKKLISAFLAIIMLMGMSVPALAFNYSFSSGANHSDVFGKSTSTDNLVTPDPMSENVRRNKDAAHNPPPFGTGSGSIATDQASLYHNNSPQFSGTTGTPSMSVSYSSNLPPVPSGSVSPVTDSDFGSMLPSTSLHSSDILHTLPLYYEDGSIGTLSIPKLNLTVKVYSGTTLENMRIGLGHFEFTSAWHGNVGLSGHNRGVPHAIGGIARLADGEEIIFTTRYGTRTYEIIHREQISDTDYSWFGWSERNLLTIVTCVDNTPGVRWVIVARER